MAEEIYRKVRKAGAGKGDQRRPGTVSSSEFADNWTLAFGKPARPGPKRPICGPIQWRPCANGCGNVTSFTVCIACKKL